MKRMLVGNRRCAKDAGMFAMRLLEAVGSLLHLLFRIRLGPLLFAATLQVCFEFGVLPLQLGNASKQFFNLST